MSNCERCNKETLSTTMSMFNTQMCCNTCIQRERNHPKYPKAREAEHEAISRGDYNFPGIGLPEDLKVR